MTKRKSTSRGLQMPKLNIRKDVPARGLQMPKDKPKPRKKGVDFDLDVH